MYTYAGTNDALTCVSCPRVLFDWPTYSHSLKRQYKWRTDRHNPDVTV